MGHLRSTAIVAVIMLGLLPGASAFAHLAGGEDVEVGEYVVDFGREPAELVEGATATFAVNLVHRKTLVPADVDAVFVRVSQGERIVYAGTHRPVEGNVTFSLAIPTGGPYEVFARFEKDGQELVSTVSSIDVASIPTVPADALPQPQTRLPGSTAALIVVAFASGALVMRFIRRP